MKDFFIKHKEIVLYVFFGALTTLVNYAVYFALTVSFFKPDVPLLLQAANLLSWLSAVVFAYFTNRKYVFESKTSSKQREFFLFFLSRLSTLIIDAAIMGVFVSLLSFNDKIIKIFSQIAVIILNYVFSKLIVFKKGGEKT